MKMISVESYLIKKFSIKDIDSDEKIVSMHDLLLLSRDTEFLKCILKDFSKPERNMLMHTFYLGRVERYVYGVYFNHYKRIINNRKEGKPISRLSTRTVKSYIKKYYPNFHFRKNINVDKMVKKLKNKAYYDVFK